MNKQAPEQIAPAPLMARQATFAEAQRLWDVLALLWCAGVTAGLFWLFRHRGFDDPYITYRYAQHLARGDGFVYNTGERVLSTTTPFYTMLLALLRLLGLDLPLVSNLIGCASLALCGWALWRLGHIVHAAGIAFVGLLLLPTFPHLLQTLGAESCFFLGCVLLAFVSYEERHYTSAAALLAIATLTRADAVLAGLIMGLDFLLARRGPLPWRALLVFIGLLLPWFAFAWIYFGAPLPVTLFAKRQQGLMANSQSFFDGLFVYGRQYWNQPVYWGHFGCAMIGLLIALVHYPRRLLIPAWSLLYFVAYSVLGVTRYFWYYAPLVPGFIVLIGIGIDALSRVAGRLSNLRSRQGLALLLVVPMLVVQLSSLNTLRLTNDRRFVIYRVVGEWLAAHTPPEASVGTLEVGIIGYYSQRRMIDFAGLIQPEVALRLGPESDYDDAGLWAVQRFKPDYLVLTGGSRLLQEPAIASQCSPAETFSDPGFGQLVVYGCRWQGSAS